MVVLKRKYDLHPLEDEYKTRGISLRDYQKVGVRRMLEWFENGVGGINADEMGLGKTCQAIVVMSTLLAKGKGPFIVLAPVSVTSHWMVEVEKFSCGALEPVLCYPCTHIKTDYPNGLKVKKNMVFITGSKVIQGKRKFHPLLETERLLKTTIPYVIIDEAQVLKGCSSFRQQLYKHRENRFFLLLTGTPLQNDVSEAFSLLQFLDNVFEDVDVKDFVLEHSTPSGLLKLKTILDKYMIRRLKSEVMVLPESTEVVLYHGLTPMQKKMYLDYIQGNPTTIRTVSMFMQMRKLISHPYLFKGVEPEPFEDGEHLVLESGKMRMFSDLCRYLHARNHKVLVFAQFLKTCYIIEDIMDMRGYEFRSMTGGTARQDRNTCVEDFQNDPGVFAFIMTTKTGGVGLTLTAADTVIFFDSDLNPHNDLQAMARTHRIGQTKPVRVIRLIGSGTVDDYVYNIAFRKLKLHKGVTGEKVEPRCTVEMDIYKQAKRMTSAITDAVGLTDEDIEVLLGKTENNKLWSDFVDNDENPEFVQDCNERSNRLDDFMKFEGEDYRGVRSKRVLEREEFSWSDYKEKIPRKAGFYKELDDVDPEWLYVVDDANDQTETK